jgi:asparagine synthase (glutamine-hydrolysing)
MAQTQGWQSPICAWQDRGVGFVQRFGAPCRDLKIGITFVSAGRLDNRSELERDLGISSAESATLTDSAFLLRAYMRWGEGCPCRIYGDWMFAAWHSHEQRLFLARDHYGCTATYYYCDPHLFAFASDAKALLALNPCPLAMDEDYLAQILVARPSRLGERTIYRSILRLPPAHHLTVSQDRLNVRRYWRLEEAPELRLPHRQDYVEAFREVFDTAVRARLRPACEDKPGKAASTEGGIAVSLSGGLDSSAVAVTAARLLNEREERLTAFTSAPLYDTRPYLAQGFGDEFPLAEAVCRQAGNIDLCRIDGSAVSPIQGMRAMLDILGEPGYAASNFFWLLELQRAVQSRGYRVLLNGQAGNAGISWRGDPLSQALPFQLKHLGGRRWLKERIKRVAPPHWIAARRGRQIDPDEWYRRYPIHPGFARRLNVYERWLDNLDEAPARSPREQRLRFLEPARGAGTAKRAQMGAAHGFEYRDPTADVRVLTFTLSVPDHIFIDPETGTNRWLIRAAMEGQVPDEVRLNRGRGYQSADLVPRLRSCAPEVDAALEEIAHGPAAAYLNSAHLQEVWQQIRTQDTPEALLQAIAVLTRGIMAGLFVNGFHG